MPSSGSPLDREDSVDCAATHVYIGLLCARQKGWNLSHGSAGDDLEIVQRQWSSRFRYSADGWCRSLPGLRECILCKRKFIPLVLAAYMRDAYWRNCGCRSEPASEGRIAASILAHEDSSEPQAGAACGSMVVLLPLNLILLYE